MDLFSFFAFLNIDSLLDVNINTVLVEISLWKANFNLCTCMCVRLFFFCPIKFYAVYVSTDLNLIIKLLAICLHVMQFTKVSNGTQKNKHKSGWMLMKKKKKKRQRWGQRKRTETGTMNSDWMDECISYEIFAYHLIFHLFSGTNPPKAKKLLVSFSLLINADTHTILAFQSSNKTSESEPCIENEQTSTKLKMNEKCKYW